ncbi:hypothetical protein JX266_014480, partial [Neoarthrinium moseri]
MATLGVLEGFSRGHETPILRPLQRPITLRHLVTHTSGFGYLSFHKSLRRWSKLMGRDGENRTGTIDDYIQPLLFQPGEGWAYGPGLDWAGRVLEVVLGSTLEQIFQDFIWSSIGLRDTTFFPARRPSL